MLYNVHGTQNRRVARTLYRVLSTHYINEILMVHKIHTRYFYSSLDR